MKYKFICPKCGNEKTIEMRISEYKSDGHMCECGAELKRDPKSFCRSYQVNCDGFYAKTQSNGNGGAK